jgi:hypothetical protein
MRALVDILLIGFMLSASFAYVAPRAAEAVAERAEKMGEKALEAQERQRVAEDMAQDGWGYSAASATARQGSPEVGETASTDDGWGTN